MRASIYILLSIKTRIETWRLEHRGLNQLVFISYYPLKQGLKQNHANTQTLNLTIYILLSIKTRIETNVGNVDSGGNQ